MHNIYPTDNSLYIYLKTYIILYSIIAFTFLYSCTVLSLLLESLIPRGNHSKSLSGRNVMPERRSTGSILLCSLPHHKQKISV